PIVPGKYLRSLPISEKEIVHHASAFQGPRVFGGPLARFRYYDESLIKPFDWVALRDLDAAVYDHLTTSEWTHRDRRMGEGDRWALLGADVVRDHPDFPEPLTVELDTSKGCVRYVNKGCSFCIEPMYGKPKFREVAGVLAEVRRLAELGVVNFRLGGQADFFSYQAIGLGTSPTPRINVPVIRALLEGIRSAAPDLKVLHTDNGDPAMMLAHPDDAMAAMRDLARLASPGTSSAFGLQPADPRVPPVQGGGADDDRPRDAASRRARGDRAARRVPGVAGRPRDVRPTDRHLSDSRRVAIPDRDGPVRRRACREPRTAVPHRGRVPARREPGAVGGHLRPPGNRGEACGAHRPRGAGCLPARVRRIARRSRRGGSWRSASASR